MLLWLLNLLESSLLWLLVAKPASEAVLVAGGLAVRVVKKAGLLRLLLLLVHGIAEPVDCRLLLIALIEACRLRSLRWRAVEEQIGVILVFKLTPSQLFFLLAQFDSFLKIVVIITCTAFSFPTGLIGLCFILRGFEREAILKVVVAITIPVCTSAFASSCGRVVRRVDRAAQILETSHARFPGSTICPLCAEPLFIHDE